MPELMTRSACRQSHLDNLSCSPSFPSRKVIKEEDRYYLRSPDFEPMTDENAVRGHAAEILTRINAAAWFYYSGFDGVYQDAVVRIDEDEERHHKVMAYPQLFGANSR